MIGLIGSPKELDREQFKSRNVSENMDGAIGLDVLSESSLNILMSIDTVYDL